VNQLYILVSSAIRVMVFTLVLLLPATILFAQVDDLCDSDRVIDMSDPDQKYDIDAGTCIEIVMTDTCCCPNPANVCVCSIEIQDSNGHTIEEWLWDCTNPQCASGGSLPCAVSDCVWQGSSLSATNKYCLTIPDAGEYRFIADYCASTEVTIKCITCTSDCKDPDW